LNHKLAFILDSARAVWSAAMPHSPLPGDSRRDCLRKRRSLGLVLLLLLHIFACNKARELDPKRIIRTRVCSPSPRWPRRGALFGVAVQRKNQLTPTISRSIRRGRTAKFRRSSTQSPVPTFPPAPVRSGPTSPPQRAGTVDRAPMTSSESGRCGVLLSASAD
jgi:hypothetical protein